jgi:membrane complex biogenesis BtpA family protein
MTEKSIHRRKDDALVTLFGRRKVVIGVIHAPPLPGSPEYQGAETATLYERAVEEGRRYAEGGVDGIIVENHGDIPFLKPDEIGPETAAVMAVMAHEDRRTGAVTALAVAKAAGAGFVRVNQWTNAYVANEGIVEGPAARATRYRAWLHARPVRIFADVHVKHGAHAIVADRGLAELTRDAEFFDADVLIATGQRTGDAAALDEIRAIRQAASLPVIVGSGADKDNIGDLLAVADGVIVASSLKQDGVWWNPVDPDRVRAFMAAADAARSDGGR